MRHTIPLPPPPRRDGVLAAARLSQRGAAVLRRSSWPSGSGSNVPRDVFSLWVDQAGGTARLTVAADAQSVRISAG
jgi:hypothetical protein